MRFEWDIYKDRANRRKHGIEFSVAELVFSDPLAQTIQDREVGDEERWQTVGRTPGGNLLSVAHTTFDDQTDEVIRIISARKATPHERRRFEDTTET